MENQILVFEHEKFGKVHGYIDSNGTAWFNVEDIARGLGFTQIKKGVEYVRYETVNNYLNQFGYNSFSQLVGKDDFIPENMVYRLAMKAKNETAEDFQAWLADDVVPSIRKTGSYSLPKNETPVAVQNQPPVLHKILEDIKTSYKLMGEIFKVQDGIAIAKVISIVERFNGVVLPELKELIPPAEHEIGRYTSTQLAKKFGLKSAQAVNQILLEAGLQEKDVNGGYILTEKGAEYAEAMPFERNGHTGYQIKWTPEVMEFFK